MQDVNPNSWGSWDGRAPQQEENSYDMYPGSYTGNPVDTAPLTLRATEEEADCKGWVLSESDEAEAAQAAVAERVRWQSSTRPLGSMIAQRTLETQQGDK